MHRNMGTGPGAVTTICKATPPAFFRRRRSRPHSRDRRESWQAAPFGNGRPDQAVQVAGGLPNLRTRPTLKG